MFYPEPSPETSQKHYLKDLGDPVLRAADFEQGAVVKNPPNDGPNDYSDKHFFTE